jgi:DNA-binding NarL/FixJ family response regulator
MPINSEMNNASQIDHDLMSDDRIYAVCVGSNKFAQIDVELLKAVFDLTMREAEVCRDLHIGFSPQDIALKSSRSIKMVRNQIKAVLEKVGANS